MAETQKTKFVKMPKSNNSETFEEADERFDHIFNCEGTASVPENECLTEI